MAVSSYRERIAVLFRAHPGAWMDGLALAQVGGAYAWRSRVSECRQGGMVIENRQRTRADGSTVSEYRYLPPEPQQQELPVDTGDELGATA